MADYVIDGVEDDVRTKTAGQVDGEQLVVQNCKRTKVFVFDHCASINVDDCEDCTLFLGCCKGSVFIRDCTNVRVLTLCQQLRTRDCNKLDIFLHCTTMPIIEESTQVRVHCAQVHYALLGEHMRRAQLSTFNNNWSRVHDFTPAAGNFTIVTDDEADREHQRQTFAAPVDADAAGDMPLSLEFRPESSVVPLTLPETDRRAPTAFVLFMTGGFKQMVQQSEWLHLQQTALKLTQFVHHEEPVCFTAISTRFALKFRHSPAACSAAPRFAWIWRSCIVYSPRIASDRARTARR